MRDIKTGLRVQRTGRFLELLAPYSQTYWFPNTFPTYANDPENAVFGVVLRGGFSNASAGSESTGLLLLIQTPLFELPRHPLG